MCSSYDISETEINFTSSGLRYDIRAVVRETSHSTESAS